MKRRLISFLLALAVIVSCSAALSAAEDVTVLRVYNWQEYIDDGTDDKGTKVRPSVMEDWEEDYFARTGKRVRVQYDTFETNETMLNTLKTGKSQYDLVCPSDYVIQKMILATEKGTDDKISLEKFDFSAVPNYVEYGSPFIRDVYEANGFSEYLVGYMWGTLGIIYNPEYVNEEDVTTWELFLNPDYKGKSTLKDSVRDSYLPAVAVVYKEEIEEWNAKLEAGTVTTKEYAAAMDEILNRTDPDTIEKAGKVLKEMKNNIYGLEVDSGKSDIVSGKITINAAWSGDAVYSMDVAEEEDDVYLSYVVPDDGASIWFDGWVMPKGANVELAQDFVNYLCTPAVAAQNMDFIGYTSVIAGDDVLALVDDWYGDAEGEYSVDLTYFFGGTCADETFEELESVSLEDGRILVRTGELGRQFSAQYPDEDTVYRCGIMKDFGDRNDDVLLMWAQFKSNNVSAWLIIMFIAVLLGFCLIVILFTKPKRDSARRYKEWTKTRSIG